jgi:hypothetical protein
MYVAWHQAAFGRSKRMPPLSDALGEKSQPKYRSNAQMVTMLRKMEKSGIGLTFRKVPAPPKA